MKSKISKTHKLTIDSQIKNSEQVIAELENSKVILNDDIQNNKNKILELEAILEKITKDKEQLSLNITKAENKIEVLKYEIINENKRLNNLKRKKNNNINKIVSINKFIPCDVGNIVHSYYNIDHTVINGDTVRLYTGKNDSTDVSKFYAKRMNEIADQESFNYEVKFEIDKSTGKVILYVVHGGVKKYFDDNGILVLNVKRVTAKDIKQSKRKTA